MTHICPIYTAKLCENEGIEHDDIAPYTPHHNGVVERKNKIVLNSQEIATQVLG